jgi:uncharacterized protein involved in high-affinity Fe2+ transport
MSRPRTPRLLLAAGLALVLAGCASADKNQPAATKASNTPAKSTTTGMSGMSGMNVGTSGSELPAPNGIRPVAIRTLATGYWQDMEIQAQTMTPTPFVVYTAGAEQMHKPAKSSAFHLMVMLTDRHTHVQIAYAAVWATIVNSKGKSVYSATQWPMNSEYMGVHYGNNVPYLAPGNYTLKLQITPPDEGRHLEYAHMWLKIHTLTEHFSWKPTT